MGSLENVFEKENLMKFVLKCNTTINPIEEVRTEIIDVRTDILNIGNEGDILLNTNVNHIEESEMINDSETKISKKKKKTKNDKKVVSNNNETNAINGIQNVEAKSNLSEHTRKVPENVTFVVEPKIDGLSLSVRYSGNGTFLGAGTRGDGIEGEDVSGNIEVRL
jgi:NAD-dependent DNA ligase adenylation domain